MRTVPGSSGPGVIRLVGEIAYDDRPGQIEECWFEFPEQYADSLCLSGSPWLACLLPVATTLGEPLRIRLPVDPLLYHNAFELLAIWKAWFPQLRTIEVIADRAEEGPKGSRTGAFFSCGVDSFFTLLHNESSRPDAWPVDELICVGGLDIPLKNLDAFFQLRTRMEGVAEPLGKRLIPVVTNLRATRLEAAGWYRLLHGPGLVAIGLMLGARYDKVLIAGANNYEVDEHAGSHPLTDPFLSTSRTRVIHDGSRFSRSEKLEFLASSDIAMGALHVCWRNASDANCGACEKCIRTMLALEIVGRLQDCKTFPAGHMVDLVSRLFLLKPARERAYRLLRALAIARGRPEIARSLDRCLRRSRRLRSLVARSRRMRDKRLLWRVAGPLERLLLRNTIQ